MSTPGYVDILKRLVGYATVSSQSNLDLIDDIEQLLIQLGFKTERIYNADQTKANLMARTGPSAKPHTPDGIMLAGHTDVVPVTGQNWDSDPFTLTKKGERLYGRGTSDMKGFIALVLDVVSRLDLSTLKEPLYLCFTYDEEVGCFGAKNMVDYFSTHTLNPRFVMIGEPTDSKLVVAHKGVALFTTKVKGKPAHASCPHLGSNAISFASRLITKINTCLPQQENNAFDPPGTTLNIGTISGGVTTNIIAEHCQFRWEVRPLPDENLNNFITKLNEFSTTLAKKETSISVENIPETSVPGLKAGKNSVAVDYISRFLTDSSTTTVPYVTEAGLYQEANIPAVVCGPGSVTQAHQPNESISIEEMDTYKAFITRLLNSLL